MVEQRERQFQDPSGSPRVPDARIPSSDTGPCVPPPRIECLELGLLYAPEHSVLCKQPSQRLSVVAIQLRDDPGESESPGYFP